MLEFKRRIRHVDKIIQPAGEDATLTLENLTGHPAVGLSAPWLRGVSR